MTPLPDPSICRRSEKNRRRRNQSPLRGATRFFSVDYFTQYAKVRISYRGDFFISLVTSFAATIFQVAFVVVLFQKAPQLARLAFRGSAVSLRFLADSLRPVQRDQHESLRFRQQLHHRRKIRPHSAAPDFFAVSDSVRNFSDRVVCRRWRLEYSAWCGRRAACASRGRRENRHAFCFSGFAPASSTFRFS